MKMTIYLLLILNFIGSSDSVINQISNEGPLNPISRVGGHFTEGGRHNSTGLQRVTDNYRFWGLALSDAFSFGKKGKQNRKCRERNL